jgi:dTDP-glucose pyrophosphorylase
MEKPILVIMAAGMGSRYGGAKQIDPINEQGELIVDFSLYDALMAGYEKAVFIIKREMEVDVREVLDAGAGKHMEIRYAYQELSDLPEGYSVPEGRVKPWGTCHAVYSARNLIDGPFTVVNADDYYGPNGFQLMYDALSMGEKARESTYYMNGYLLKNTITDHGSVARGVCSVDEKDFLTDVTERIKIMSLGDHIAYTEDDEIWIPIEGDATVSMNFWGFPGSFIEEIKAGFPAVLDAIFATDPLKGEYQLPTRVNEVVANGDAAVKVLKTDDQWYGVTYKEDKESVVSALRSLKDKGLYPEILWQAKS